MRWFLLDFSEESQEEKDFLKEKEDDWKGASTLAFEIFTQYQILTKQKKSLDILQDQIWWDTQRFSHFGERSIQAFKETPALYKKLRTMFKDQNDKLSYFDFFNFIEHDLKLQLENWEEEALQQRLDAMGMAFIEFNELNEFFDEYGYKTGEPIIEDDYEHQLEVAQELSYRDYQVTEADYFMNCPTMLKSEKAALAVCRQLYKECKRNKVVKWQDPDFGPKNDKDAEGNAKSLYPNGEIPQKGYIEPEKVKWMWSDDRCDAGNESRFVMKGTSGNECKQGDLGDCWFISALSIVANRDELILGGLRGMDYDDDLIIDKEIARAMSRGVFPPIFHKFRSKGIYCLRFFKNFDWIYVIVDERIPVNKETKEPIFGRVASNNNEIWVQTIEKGYAKLHGNYGNLISGYIDEGIQELTGMQPFKIPIRDDKSGVFPHKQLIHMGLDKDKFWAMLKDNKEDGSLMGASIKGEGKEGQLVIDGQPTGLIMNHAYAIKDVFDLSKYIKGSDERLMVLFNPWGKTEWQGAWSANSAEFKNKRNRAALEEYNDKLDEDEELDLDADDGVFFMSFDDFINNFSTLFVNFDFPEEWTGVRFKSEWTKFNSAGLPRNYTMEERKKFSRNPQFLIRPEQDTMMVFSAVQVGGRLPTLDRKGNQVFFKYPFVETLHYANVSLFELGYGERILDNFDKGKLKLTTPIKRERENCAVFNLKQDTSYVIVPSTAAANDVGEFFLSIYINCDLRNIEIKRVFGPGDNNEGEDEVLPQFIKEEAEKQFTVPSWKLQLAKNMLPYMMTEDDTDVKIEADSSA